MGGYSSSSSDGQRKSKRSSKKSKKKDKKSKKEKRKRKREARMATMFGYTNESNPFGDANLSEAFVWEKKIRKDQKRSKRERDEEEKNSFLRTDHLDEINRAREMRSKREEARVERERQKEIEARLREAQTFQDWEQKEEEFHLQQQKERSKIRIKGSREKVIDILAKNLLLYEEYLTESRKHVDDDSVMLGLQIPMEMEEPYKIFEKLDLNHLMKVRDDILEYKQLEISSPKLHSHKEYWDALLFVLNDTIRREERKHNSYTSSGVHDKVDHDLHKLLLGKNSEELEKLKVEVMHKLSQNSQNTDVEYWEEVKQGIDVAICKKLVDRLHGSILKARLELMKKHEKLDDKSTAWKTSSTKPSKSSTPPYMYTSLEDIKKAAANASVAAVTPYQDRFNSNKQRTEELNKANSNFEHEIEDYFHKSKPTLDDKAIDAIIEEEESRPTEGEDVMPNRDVVKLPIQSYTWQDKFAPRKPRFYNRIKTGYEWNKYNQAHYDEDNPPPKAVTGYKFNIFYPDLIDTTKTPSYKVEKADSPEFCILKFQAGPPYEDIAFKILSKEWAKQTYQGFKCVFERGILQLHFNFKKLHYRR